GLVGRRQRVAQDLVGIATVPGHAPPRVASWREGGEGQRLAGGAEAILASAMRRDRALWHALTDVALAGDFALTFGFGIGRRAAPAVPRLAAVARGPALPRAPAAGRGAARRAPGAPVPRAAAPAAARRLVPPARRDADTHCQEED